MSPEAKERRDVLGPRRIGHIDGVVVPIRSGATDVIRQPIWRPRTLMPKDWRRGYGTAICARSKRHARQQLREPTVLGEIVDVDLRTVGTVPPVICSE